ncbi:GIDE domain-containing protein [Thiorhodospira sibirica]|uniref:GIDE domain-containing protein n=1 Tax=Thiorhodospira sibirica TaxID=154347 RepID=UPI00022C0B7E|nr:GIDE domain-containing protein [Thiorhodospira sibirica]
MFDTLALHVQTTDTFMVLVQITLTGLASTLCAYFFVRHLGRARLVADTPTAKIRSAPQGHVELSGHGRLIEGTPIIAPLTRRECLWYEYTVEQQQRNQRGGNHWKSVDKGRSEDLFYLQDDTGVCVIDPHKATIFAHHQDRWSGSSRWPEFGPQARTFLDLGSYRYTERRLESGDSLYAIGYFRTHGYDDQHALQDEITSLLRAWKKDPEKMASFGLSPRGPIDLNAWEAVRAAAAQEALMLRAQRTTLPAVHLLSRGPDRSRPFILSADAEPEKRIIGHYLRWAILAALGMASLGTLSLVMLVLLLWN